MVKNFSVMQEVTADMEWCAEAYLTADYDDIKLSDFEETVKNYILFNLKCNESPNEDFDETEEDEVW